MGCGASTSPRFDFVQEGGAEISLLEAELQSVGLTKAVPFLTKLGVESKRDLHFVEQEDLEQLHPVILRRKLWAFIDADKTRGAAQNSLALRQIERGPTNEEVVTVHRKQVCMVDPVSGKPKAMIVMTRSFRARRQTGQQEAMDSIQNRAFSASSPALLTNHVPPSPPTARPLQIANPAQSADVSTKQLFLTDFEAQPQTHVKDGRLRASIGIRPQKDPIRSMRGAGDLFS
jgi:hypothetical protein